MTEKYTPEKVAELAERLRGDILDAVPDDNDMQHVLELAADALTAVSAERDAYKRAKAENDERFMIERDEARAERDQFRTAWNAYGFEIIRLEDDRDRLHKALMEALAAVGEVNEWDGHGRADQLDNMRRILRAALDKEGQIDEPGNPEA